MKHPSEYVPVQFDGVTVMVVDSGTVIKDERTGQEIEVTDTVNAVNGALIYCTQRTFDLLKVRSTEKSNSTEKSE